MTTAAYRREELEAFLWRHVAPAFDDRREGAAVVKAVLDRADAMVKTVRPPRAPAKPREKKPPAVHYAVAGGRTACRPGEFSSASGRYLASGPQFVTCGHCRKTPAWQEAAELLPPLPGKEPGR